MGWGGTGYRGWPIVSGGGGIGGSGTVNYLCKFSPDGSNIGNSALYQSGLDIGINTITPDGVLDIEDAAEANVYIKGGEASNSYLHLICDDGDDDPDRWRVGSEIDGTFAIASFSTGVFVDILTITPTKVSIPAADLIVTTGSVGIGVATPDTELQLHQNSSGSIFMHITNTETGPVGATGLLLGIDAGEHVRFINYENTDIIIETNAIERMRVNNVGDVSIVTKFTINGSFVSPHVHLGSGFGTDGLADASPFDVITDYILLVKPETSNPEFYTFSNMSIDQQFKIENEGTNVAYIGKSGSTTVELSAGRTADCYVRDDGELIERIY